MEETLEMKHNVFLRWGSRLFIAFVFLLPIFFIPSQVVPFAFGKGLFLSLAVFALTILVLFSILKEGKVSLPKSTSLLGLALVLLAYIASGLASSQHELSLMGQGFEIDTAFMMLVLFLVAVLVPLLFRAKNTLFNVYISLLVSFLVVAVVSFARFFAPTFLSFGVLSGNTANVVGTWNDLGFFAGLTTVISLISLGVLHSKGFWKVLLSLSLAFGVVLLMIVNFTTLWYIIGFFSLAFFLYSHSYARHPAHQGEGHKKTVSYAPVVVLVIAVLFIFWGTSLGGKISNWLSISQIEARPSWSTTLSITKQVLKTDPVFGVGPNKFVNEWLKFKPLQVNESPFWSLDFSSGVGTVPTTFVTLGGVGILAWVIFFVLFLFEGFRAIRKLHGDAFAHYLAISSFVSALFLWLVAIFYTPSHVVYALAFIFTGIFVTNLVLEKVVGEYHFAFSSHPAKSFVGSLVTIVLIIGAVTCFYIGSERALAYGTFNGAILKYQSDGNLATVENYVKQSLRIKENDVFYRTLSGVFLAQLNVLAGTNPAPGKEEEVKAQFQNILAGAVGSAQEAVRLNSENYLNHLSLAQAYASVVPLKIDGFYEQATASYKKAVALNPTSPALRLQLAQLEVAHSDNVKAREYIGEAINVKNNYTDAIFLLTQIEVGEGNTRKAIEAVTAGTLISPTNPILYFQLGLLYYNNSEYANAGRALERAIALEPNYANAKYFLGLTYYRLGKLADAKRLFVDLKASNPDNQEVTFILGNLESGKSPFANVAAPLDSKPEKRKSPPVTEKKSKEVPTVTTQ